MWLYSSLFFWILLHFFRFSFIFFILLPQAEAWGRDHFSNSDFELKWYSIELIHLTRCYLTRYVFKSSSLLCSLSQFCFHIIHHFISVLSDVVFILLYSWYQPLYRVILNGMVFVAKCLLHFNHFLSRVAITKGVKNKND